MLSNIFSGFSPLEPTDIDPQSLLLFAQALRAVQHQSIKITNDIPTLQTQITDSNSNNINIFQRTQRTISSVYRQILQHLLYLKENVSIPQSYQLLDLYDTGKYLTALQVPINQIFTQQPNIMLDYNLFFYSLILGLNIATLSNSGSQRAEIMTECINWMKKILPEMYTIDTVLDLFILDEVVCTLIQKHLDRDMIVTILLNAAITQDTKDKINTRTIPDQGVPPSAAASADASAAHTQDPIPRHRLGVSSSAIPLFTLSDAQYILAAAHTQDPTSRPHTSDIPTSMIPLLALPDRDVPPSAVAASTGASAAHTSSNPSVAGASAAHTQLDPTSQSRRGVSSSAIPLRQSDILDTFASTSAANTQSYEDLGLTLIEPNPKK